MMTYLTDKALLALMCLACATQVHAQFEVESPLLTNPQLIAAGTRTITAQQTTRSSDVVLNLPFFDDFSRYSLPTTDESIPVEWQRWCDNHAFINTGLPIQPPTIGVATLDGLAANGYPWSWLADNTFGPSDTLTSLPIDLSGLTSLDNTFVSFFYQSGGLGNPASGNATLALDFYIDLGDDGVWTEVWSAEGQSVSAFERVYVDVADTEFEEAIFADGFQFRFRSEGFVSGAFSMWHLDYVEVRQNINPEDDGIEDLAFMYPGTTLLRSHTSMPWDHFKENPSFFMDPDTVLTYQQNLGSTVNFVTGYNVTGPDMTWGFPNAFANTSGNGFSVIRTEMSVQGIGGQVSVSNDFVYETMAAEEADTCAVFQIDYFHDATDIHPQNDTASFVQTFQNYYAYDDGTAEKAYAVNEVGAKIALRYHIEKDDELLGLFIHFLPHGDQVENENFMLRAWTDDGGMPGEELGVNFVFHNPQYHITGHNVFTYYPYDNPIDVVEGDIYVGFIQDTQEFLNVGNDKSGLNRNPEQLFYAPGPGVSFIQSTITGSLMIRPVFRSGKSGVIWNDIDEVAQTQFDLYPNPSGGAVQVQVDAGVGGVTGRVLSMTGALVHQFAGSGNLHLNLHHLPAGVYMIEVMDVSGNTLGRRRLLKH